ncbi:protein fem-1C-like [Tropilaelaps mercedesae]|uniref:Protein fem-1C-like n=1 Tax=Tropilaelaps mercedesae TaxID=418985 RepID=A0A1V9XHZ1_9ACAR|nr:protein fem-1C-like [Tropilaelaps mercedesae]
MWLTGKNDRSQQRDTIFKEVIIEVRQAGPSCRFTPALRHKLERFTLQERSQLVNRVRDGCTPLFTAAKKGIVEIVRYLLETCGANAEQRGVYEVPFDHTMHYVTPLWCAAVVGKIEVCRVLVEHGADVNTMSDTGSTAVRSACYMSNIDVVKFLVGLGADVNRPNQNGGTCLINSVQSVELCQFLIDMGADMNARDSQFKTALHYAVQEDRVETTRLLLSYGADHLSCSKHGDDVLQTACLKGSAKIAEYLIETMNYPPARVADALELLGATYLDENHDNTMALEYWRRACTYREMHKIEKIINDPPKKVFLNRVPFKTLDDVNALAHDMDEMRLQSLLVNERVLGPSHKDSIFRLMYRGAAYADSMQHQRCIDLWQYAVEIRLSKDTVLHNETCIALQSLTKILFDAHDKHAQGVFDAPINFNDVNFLLDKLMNCFPAAIEQLKQRPVFRKQQENWDRVLKILIHLLHLAEVLPKFPPEKENLRRLTRKLILLNPRMTNGNSLLHMAVGKVDSLRQSYFDDHRQQQQIFPDPVTTSMLLHVGANVEAVNEDGSTPLHTASLRVNYREKIVRMLLDAGAHIDRTNKQGNQPYRMLGGNQECRIKVAKLITLKCLAANKVKSNHRTYEGIVPKTLEEFIRMH